MSFIEIIVLFAAMTTLALIPSTSVALVVARSSTAGFANGSAVAAGIVVGDLVFVCLAVSGMTALAEVMGSSFLVLRYLAGAYLIWFGIGLMRSRPSSPFTPAPMPERSAASLSVSFFSGLALTLGDMKAILFYASFFPTFVDVTRISTADMLTIAAVTVVAVGGVKLGYAYFAQRVAAMARNLKADRAIRITAGSFMVGAGAYLMAKT